MNAFKKISLIFCSALFFITLPACAELKIDTAKSGITIVFKQMSVPVKAPFKKWDAHIDFDEARIQKTQARVNIDINSFDLGSTEYNREVLKKEWFHAAQFPKASFTTQSIQLRTPNTLEITGLLTIKGKTSSVQFPLTFKKDHGNVVFDGTLSIKRNAFNIGEGEWKDTDIVADEVQIQFHIVTHP